MLIEMKVKQKNSILGRDLKAESYFDLVCMYVIQNKK
jgi:hypothetical protein